jgi:hypothetical protein
MTSYTPEQVTKSLMAVVAHGGNCSQAAEELIDDEFMVPESTLRLWKNETHVERYAQLQRRAAQELEDQAVDVARRIINRADALAERALDQLDGKIDGMDGKELALAVQKLADVKSKQVEKLMALTGRGDGRGEGEDLAQLARGLAQAGLLKVHVELGPGDAPPAKKPEAIEGTAT